MRTTAAVLFVSVFTTVAWAQEPAGASLRARVDALAASALSSPIAGISVAVARNGQIVLARGYGMANLSHSVAVTPATVFHIDSISKNILAAVVLKLVEEGKLRLDDDLTKYVPRAPVHGIHITVRQLLNHTSGIHSFTSLPESDDNERRDLTHDEVLALIKDKPLDFEPGSQWRYDNSGFYIGGMIVERVTEEEYGAYLREHIFKPLGMTATSLCDARVLVPHLASGYEADHGAFVNAAFLSWRLPFAAGSVCSTASDLLRWQMALNGGRVITPASLTLMRTPTVLADGTTIDYGLGTRLGIVEGHRIAGHTGGGGGYASVLETFPDDHLTIVVLTNTGSGMRPAVSMARAIARSVLALPTPPLRDLPVPSDEMAALIGRYDSDEGPVELFEGGGKVRFRIVGPGIEGTQRRQSAYVYAIDENLEVRFLVRGGHATWAQVYQGGLFADAKRRVP